MNVINKDFHDWYLTWHLSNYLQDCKIDILYAIGWEDSSYFLDLLKHYPAITVIHDLDRLPEEKSPKIAIAIGRQLTLSEQHFCASLSVYENILLWDISIKYKSYEKARLPINYIVDEFHSGNESDFFHYTADRDAISAGYIHRYIKKRYETKQNALFNKIEIETLNRCNGSCSFCPVNHKTDSRKYCKMDEKLFFNIIQQLHDLKYDGALGLFSNNEPLLDNRIVDFARIAREQLPYSFLYIYTNGSLLTWSLLTELLESLDLIHIDCYGNTPKLSLKMQHLHQLCCQNKIPPEKVTFHLRNDQEILTSRGGNAPNRKTHVQVNSLCPLPFSQMIIRPDGKVSQCCNDALGQVSLGDLTTQSITDVWYGDAIEQLRKNMLYKGRLDNMLCMYCDTIFTCLPYEERSLRNGSYSVFPDYSSVSNC